MNKQFLQLKNAEESMDFDFLFLFQWKDGRVYEHCMCFCGAVEAMMGASDWVEHDAQCANCKFWQHYSPEVRSFLCYALLGN